MTIISCQIYLQSYNRDFRDVSWFLFNIILHPIIYVLSTKSLGIFNIRKFVFRLAFFIRLIDYLETRPIYFINSEVPLLCR